VSFLNPYVNVAEAWLRKRHRPNIAHTEKGEKEKKEKGAGVHSRAIRGTRLERTVSGAICPKVVAFFRPDRFKGGEGTDPRTDRERGKGRDGEEKRTSLHYSWKEPVPAGGEERMALSSAAQHLRKKRGNSRPGQCQPI